MTTLPENYFAAILISRVLHLFDKNMMLNIIKESGFEIDYCNYIARPDYPLDRQLDGRECVVAIARKNNLH